MHTMALIRVSLGSVIALVAAGCETQPPLVPPPMAIADPPPTPNGEVPGRGTSDLDRGLAYVENNAFAEAVPYLLKALEAMPNHAQATYYLALCFDRTGKRKEAEAGYLRSLVLDPRLVHARINLGAIYLEDPPRPENAIATLLPAVADEPNAVDLHLNLAYAYRLTKNLDKAAHHYRAALEAGDNVETRQMLADVLYDAGKTTELVVELKALLPHFDKDATKVAAFGLRFAKAGAYQECADTFTKAIALDGKDPSYWLNRGICRHELKQPEDVLSEDYQKALALNEKFQPAWYYLGVSYLQMKKRAKALDAFDKCYKLGPTTPVGQKAKERWNEMIQASKK